MSWLTFAFAFSTTPSIKALVFCVSFLWLTHQLFRNSIDRSRDDLCRITVTRRGVDGNGHALPAVASATIHHFSCSCHRLQCRNFCAAVSQKVITQTHTQ